ncbi:unnamed protein product, partial [Adineta ricciae]
WNGWNGLLGESLMEGLESAANFTYVMESDKLMFNGPMDVIDHFIQNRLKHGLDMGINEESFEHYVYDVIEVQLLKSINLSNFDSPPDDKWTQILFPTCYIHSCCQKSTESNIYGGIICFKLRDVGFNRFNTQDLNETTQESTNSLQWVNSDPSTGLIDLGSPHVFRPDAIRGGICNKAEKVHRSGNEKPSMKILQGRKSIQIYVKSTNMAAKLDCSIFGIYMFGVSTS